jgi:Flp pilus assembly protein TadD
MPKVINVVAPSYLAAYALVAALGVVAWRARRNAGALVGLAAIAVLLLPTLGVVQNGPQIVADRYTYHAAPALAVLVAGLLVAIPARLDVPARALAAIVLIAFGVGTWRQSRVWHDSESLWRRVLAVDTTSPIARVGLAVELAKRGAFDESARLCREAITRDPAYAEAHNNLGVALTRLGDAGGAVPSFVRAIELKPDYGEAYSNWGNALVRLGDADGARDLYRRAVAANPGYADAHVNWGNALVRMDSAAAAIPHYEEAVRLRPDNADAHLNWGVALARLSRFPDAAEQFRRALVLSPGMPEATEYLARVQQMDAAQRAGRSP